MTMRAAKARSFGLSTIVEIHHPEYLRLSDLIEIYGEVEITTGIEPLLAFAWQKMN